MPEKDPLPKDKSILSGLYIGVLNKCLVSPPINLRLLLVDGKRQDFLFSPSTSASEIAHHVFHNWPEDWNGGETLKPDRSEVLRLIYRGRFLHSSTTLEYLSLPLGKTSTLHMIVRERLPDESHTGLMDARAKVVGQEHSRCCVIL